MNKTEHTKLIDVPSVEIGEGCGADKSVSLRHRVHDGSAFDSVSGGASCMVDSPIPRHCVLLLLLDDDEPKIIPPDAHCPPLQKTAAGSRIAISLYLLNVIIL